MQGRMGSRDSVVLFLLRQVSVLLRNNQHIHVSHRLGIYAGIHKIDDIRLLVATKQLSLCHVYTVMVVMAIFFTGIDFPGDFIPTRSQINRHATRFRMPRMPRMLHA